LLDSLLQEIWEIYLIAFPHRPVRHAITGNKIERKLFCIQAGVESITRTLLGGELCDNIRVILVTIFGKSE